MLTPFYIQTIVIVVDKNELFSIREMDRKINNVRGTRRCHDYAL
jgi:hypothetical protein